MAIFYMAEAGTQETVIFAAILIYAAIISQSHLIEYDGEFYFYAWRVAKWWFR